MHWKNVFDNKIKINSNAMTSPFNFPIGGNAHEIY